MTSALSGYDDGKEDGLKDALTTIVNLREKFHSMKDTRATNVLDRAIKEVKERLL